MTAPAIKTARSTSWRLHRIRDVLLAILATAAGSIDALTWLALGKVFSAFMTGNVVFIAVGLASHDSVLALHGAIALSAFGVGAWATAAVMPPERPSMLWPTRVTNGLFGCALLQMAFWLVWLTVGGHPGSTVAIVLLGISAFAMGTQTAIAVGLGVHAVFTTAATATWTVLAGDSAHWSSTQTERRRLALVLAGTLCGALAGGLLLTYARAWMPLLPVALTGGVALAARLSVEGHVDLDKASLSSASRPQARAFGRSPDRPWAISDGR